MSFLDQLFTELTGIEKNTYREIPTKIQLLSEHYLDIFGTTTGVVIVATEYSESIAKLLYRAKYIGDVWALNLALPTLDEAFKYLLSFGGEDSQLVLSYVPIGINRLIERGFNQGRYLAKYLSKQYGIPLARVACLPWSSGHQSRRTQKDRTTASSIGFYPIPRISGSGKTLILVDDVISTGATLRRLIVAIAGQDWDHIIILALARNTQDFEGVEWELYICENGLVR